MCKGIYGELRALSALFAGRADQMEHAQKQAHILIHVQFSVVGPHVSEVYAISVLSNW